MINSNSENVPRTEQGSTINILGDLINTQEQAVLSRQFEVETIDVDIVKNDVMEVREVINMLNE